MKLGKHAVKVLTVFAVLFVVGFALKFLNLHEGFVTIDNGEEAVEVSAFDYGSYERAPFLRKVKRTARNLGFEYKTQPYKQIMIQAVQEANDAGLKFTNDELEKLKTKV